MAETDGRPEWLTVGAPVVVFRPSQHLGSNTITATTVAKIGKRDVVCANGFRCNVDRLRKSNGDWSPFTYLLPPDDPRVASARRENRRRALIAKTEAAWERFRRSRVIEDGRDVMAAIEAFIDHEKSEPVP